MKKSFILTVAIFITGFYSCSNYEEIENTAPDTQPNSSLKIAEASAVQNRLIASDVKYSYCCNKIGVDIYGNAYFCSNSTLRMYSIETEEISDLFNYSSTFGSETPSSIAVDSKQNIFLLNGYDYLYQFNSQGQILRDFKSNNLIFDTEDTWVTGVCAAPNDEIFVITSQGGYAQKILKKITPNGKISIVANLGSTGEMHVRGGGVYCSKGQYVYVSPSYPTTFYMLESYVYAQVTRSSGEFTFHLPGFQFTSIACALNTSRLYLLRYNDLTIHSINPSNQQMILITQIPTTITLEDGTLIENGKPNSIYPTPDADAFYILYENGYLTKLTL